MTQMPERIQIKRTKGWRMPAGAVKIDRSTRWGNQFKVDATPMRNGDWMVFRCTDGNLAGPPVSFHPSRKAALAASVAHHREYLLRPEAELLRRRIRTELVGQTLACWCRVGDPCHGDTLLELANAT